MAVLFGLCVLTRYNNKFYRIEDILFDKNPESSFDCQGIQMRWTVCDWAEWSNVTSRWLTVSVMKWMLATASSSTSCTPCSTTGSPTRNGASSRRSDTFWLNPSTQCSKMTTQLKSSLHCTGSSLFLEYYKKHYGIEIKDKCQPLLLNRFGWNLSYLFSHDFSKHIPYCAAFCRGAETLVTVNPHHTHKKSSRSVDSANFPHDNEVKQDEKDDKLIWIWRESNPVACRQLEESNESGRTKFKCEQCTAKTRSPFLKDNQLCGNIQQASALFHRFTCIYYFLAGAVFHLAAPKVLDEQRKWQLRTTKTQSLQMETRKMGRHRLSCLNYSRIRYGFATYCYDPWFCFPSDDFNTNAPMTDVTHTYTTRKVASNR